LQKEQNNSAPRKQEGNVIMKAIN